MARPEDFLGHAVKLLKTAGNDVEYRAVIESAYYGAFHAAREFEESLPLRSVVNTSSTGSHDALLQRLECPNANLDYALSIISKDIGGQMRQLKALRELAFYEISEPVHVGQAEQTIEGAKDVISECAAAKKKLQAGKNKS